jgi:hypothetical protein
MHFVVKKNSRIGSALAVAAALVTSTTVVHAQSTDRDHPTRMTSSEIKGVGDGTLKEYFYTFVAGPGELVLTLDATAKSGYLNLSVELFDTDFKSVARVKMNEARPTFRQVERFNLPRAQPVIMQVSVTSEIARYAVRVSGAVKFADSPTSAPAPAAAAPASAAPGTTDSRLACIPKSGILRIEMEDGSAQEINLARARRMFVKP